MKTNQVSLMHVVTSSSTVAAILAGAFLSMRSREAVRAEESVRVNPPAIPQEHKKHLAALQQRRKLNFSNTSLDDCLSDLSRSLGMSIKLHDSLAPMRKTTGAIRVSTPEPVSHQTAIYLIFGNVGLAFEEKQLTLVRPDHPGLSLRSYSLLQRSDFTTAVREREIQAIVDEVQPSSWSTSNETWIRPGESVFEIDVYQRQEVHRQIYHRLYRRTSPLVRDVWSSFGQSEQRETDKEIDRRMAVERMRKRYNFESIADRLKHEAAHRQAPTPKLSAPAQKRIQEADKQYEKAKKSPFSATSLRSGSLRLLHEEEVDAFIKRPGNGLIRMTPPGPSYIQGRPDLNLALASSELLPGKERLLSLPKSKGENSTRSIFLPSQESLSEFHRDGEAKFLDPWRFGYIRNRNEVAGFQGHGFKDTPRLLLHINRPVHRKEKEHWAIHRLELVSLLKHENAVVYLSRSLPQMDKLDSVKTRPLNGFERSALDQLRNGEDVVTQASMNRIEMVGSLRATKECRQCHTVKHGALLGAFTYELFRDPKVNTSPVAAAN